MYNPKQDCKKCKFFKNCFVSNLSEKERESLIGISNYVSFKDGDLIYQEGEIPENIFIVCKGRVKIYSTDYSGQQLIIWIRYPGEIFGHLAVFSEKEYLCNAQAMGDTIICKIDKIHFYNLMNQYPNISKLIIKKMSNEIRILQLKLKDTAYKPAKSKVANTLIKHISFKTKDSQYPTIYGLKRREIAEITGLALETVVRILSEFEKKKIIQRSPNFIKILDYQTLVKISGEKKE